MRASIAILLWASIGAALAPRGLAGGVGWDAPAAAQYLDERLDQWLARATRLQTGEGRVACISCHTVAPYLMVRPLLRKAMRVNEPTPQEARLLDHVARRVAASVPRACMSDAQHGGQRGTEEVLNALVLARRDALEGKPRASELTRQAFRRLWETQCADGAWDWMDFGQEPDESAGARYYGAALAAIAVGTAPTLWGGSEGYTAASEGKLRAYLREHYPRQNLYNQVWMLWAASRWPGLLTRAEGEALIAQLRRQQNADGGWSLYGLGPWRGSKVEAPSQTAEGRPASLAREASDGYATGLIVYVLLQAHVSATDAAVAKATSWLKNNQRGIRADSSRGKYWRGTSLNHPDEPVNPAGGAWERLMMTDLATAFGSLALLSVEEAPGR